MAGTETNVDYSSLLLLMNPTLFSRVWAVVKASRFPAWTFGPILFGIGVVHSRTIPRSISLLLRAALQIFALSFPLCTSMYKMKRYKSLTDVPAL